MQQLEIYGRGDIITLTAKGRLILKLGFPLRNLISAHIVHMR
ncbi:MAG: hypothetical protein Q7V56_14760 [Gammaproteobacteria bacterium]|nr:hypothetical protein [Gammaproteobacteria bacterium]